MNFVKQVGMEFLNNIVHKHGNYFVYNYNYLSLIYYYYIFISGLFTTEN